MKYQSKLGTTARGIGPAYSDFYARDSILFKDLVNNPEEALYQIQEKFFNLQTEIAQSSSTNKELINQNFSYFNSWTKNYRKFVENVSQYILENENLISDLYEDGKNILLEGAQGCGLNIYSD